jgi:hypothetical protein
MRVDNVAVKPCVHTCECSEDIDAAASGYNFESRPLRAALKFGELETTYTSRDIYIYIYMIFLLSGDI